MNYRSPRLIRSAAHGSRFALWLVILSTFFFTASSVLAQNLPPDPAVTPSIGDKPAQEEPPAKSTVRGRAVYDDTNRPVRRSRVILLEMNKHGRERTGMTNNSGEFAIKSVPAGTYVLMVDATGTITPLSFVDLENKEIEKFNLVEIRKHFEEVVVDGLRDITVKVRAKRGGAISGKVTYSDGDPAIDVRVNVMRKKDGRVTRFITNLNPTTLFGSQTDDRGRYRIPGLPSGEYIVSATEIVEHESDGSSQRGSFMGISGLNSMVVTYYQGSSKVTSATVLQVNAGQDQNEINITLIERELHGISGTVVSRIDSQPMAGARITLTNKADEVPSSSFTSPTGISTDGQGQFNFNDLPDGAYTLAIEPPYVGTTVSTNDDEETGATPVASTVTASRKLAGKQQVVTLSGSDIADLKIELSEGASVSGIVTVDVGTSIPQGTSVFLESANREKITDEGTVKEDGTFLIEGAPTGTYFPNMILPVNNRFYAKAITVNGVDLMSDPLTLSDGANVRDVRVVISGDGANLSGRVLTSNNVPASGATLVLVSADQSRWRGHFSHKLTDASDDGAYKFTSAPGDYLIIFLRLDENPRSINEAWIRQRAANAQLVTLLPNQDKTLNLIMPAP